MNTDQMRKRRIVTLEQVMPDQRDLTQNCFYCYCPKHPKYRKAIAAVEVEILHNTKSYFGICGYHAEVYPLTKEEEGKHSMWCPDCFPRK